ncbi:Calmodulin-regulated spectrin-associated protein 2 [Coelomomyces lativittatus]|nr:Calmodulin-regulated spectrin-associated protein 2 [Coelomomyces lativittatus]
MDQTLQISDLQDGFVMLQLLSLIAPEHVDVLDHISNHPNINYWNTIYCILEGNVELADWVQWDQWKAEVQSLINFTNHSIPYDSILEPIKKVLEKFFQFMSTSSYIFPRSMENRKLSSREANHCVDDLNFKDIDPNFLHCLHFILSYCKEIVYEQSKAFQELCELLSLLNVDDKAVPEIHFKALKLGHIYDLLINNLCPKSISFPIISSLYQEPENICFEIIQMCQNQFSEVLFPQLQFYLQTIFGYNAHLHTPFDLGDCFLVLLSLITKERQEFSDLFIDLECQNYWKELQHHFDNHTYTLPPYFQSDSGRLITLCMLSHMFLEFSTKRNSSQKIRVKKARLKLINPSDLALQSKDSAISIHSNEAELTNHGISNPPILEQESRAASVAETSFEDLLSFLSLYEDDEQVENEIYLESPEKTRVISLSPTLQSPSPVLSTSISLRAGSRPLSSLDYVETPMNVSAHEELDQSDHPPGVIVFSNDSFRPNKPKPKLKINKFLSNMEVVGKNRGSVHDGHLSEFEQGEAVIQDENRHKNYPHKSIEPLPPLRTTMNQCNKRLITNALQICLAGTVNSTTREEALEALKKSNSDYFVLLLRGVKHHGFKGLYTQVFTNVGISKTLKLYGVGPKEIFEDEVEVFFKYDSGSRSFKSVPTKSFSSFIHAVCLNRSGSAK